MDPNKESEAMNAIDDSSGKDRRDAKDAKYGRGVTLLLFVFLAMATMAPAPPALADGSAADYERALSIKEKTENKVFRNHFEVNWLGRTEQFWYRVQIGPATWEYVRVDAESGAVQRAAKPDALGLPTQSLTTTANTSLTTRPSRKTGGDTLIRFINRTAEPVALFWIDPEGKSKPYGLLKPGDEKVQHTFAGHVWQVADAGGETIGVFEATAEPIEMVIDGKGTVQVKKTLNENPNKENVSPNGEWAVRLENHNVAVRRIATGETTLVTKDGTPENEYHGPVSWAPNSLSFIVSLTTNVAPRQVHVIQSSPADQLQPKEISYPYPKPGDALPHPRPVLIGVIDGSVTRIDDTLFPNPFTESPELEVRWSRHSDEFFFDYNQRGHQLYRIIGVKAADCTPRVVVEEKCDTFIDYTHKTWRHWLDRTKELLWMSERDGWCRLYLLDVPTGACKAQVTTHTGVVRKVERVDETTRQVWYLASGVRAGEDPYHLHLCRSWLDGTGFTQLTQGDGNHEVNFSPDGRYFIDRWSRADLPPIAELRRSDTGALVCELERADARALLATGWSVPERFAAKGRDGQTDIFGVIIKPSNFDPARKYPVLEEVYAGPHGAFAPKTFGLLERQHALAELGFIVVQADGMGTNHRGKVFHDVAWKNLKDAGFPDRIAWIRAAAATRPWMDLDHVGIWGGSAGGQNAMRALIDHNDFYKAAFADCGCHDNRMDKIWWNEQWLGWPIDDSYIRNSNVVDAGKVQGALMLCVGEIDHNVDPASTMQVVNALEKANKDFDLLVMTGTGHGAAETPYGSRRRMDFFVRHLMGVEPRHR
jgi:dienelactone hydrolase